MQEAVNRLHDVAQEQKMNRAVNVELAIQSRIKADVEVTVPKTAFSSSKEMVEVTERMHADAEKRRRQTEEIALKQDQASQALRFIGRTRQLSEGNRRRSFDRLYEDALRTRARHEEAVETRFAEFQCMREDAEAERERMTRAHARPLRRRPKHRKPPAPPTTSSATLMDGSAEGAAAASDVLDGRQKRNAVVTFGAAAKETAEDEEDGGDVTHESGSTFLTQ